MDQNDVKLPDINERANSQPQMKRKPSFNSMTGAARSAAQAKKDRKE